VRLSARFNPDVSVQVMALSADYDVLREYALNSPVRAGDQNGHGDEWASGAFTSQATAVARSTFLLKQSQD
jgi:hypothetical protein